MRDPEGLSSTRMPFWESERDCDGCEQRGNTDYPCQYHEGYRDASNDRDEEVVRLRDELKAAAFLIDNYAEHKLFCMGFPCRCGFGQYWAGYDTLRGRREWK